MVVELKKNGIHVNRKRVQALMRTMGLETAYPKPKTTICNKEHYKYPYLLRGLKIVRPDQVWGTDITYIPIETGYIYLTAVLDLYSRYIVSWALSNSLESDFCIMAVENALKTGFKPEVMNSDQGVQYTSRDFITILKRECIAISMSGRGRCWDNIFVERLWRSLKHEEVYLKSYATCQDAEESIGSYLNHYNTKRWHQGLAYRTPKEVYFER
jgi:putative transposase